MKSNYDSCLICMIGQGDSCLQLIFCKQVNVTETQAGELRTCGCIDPKQSKTQKECYELKKYFALLLTLLFALFAMPVFAANPFAEVPKGHWAYDAVEQLAADGLVSGYQDGTFKGGQLATRYEIASVARPKLLTSNGRRIYAITRHSKKTSRHHRKRYSGAVELSRKNLLC